MKYGGSEAKDRALVVLEAMEQLVLLRANEPMLLSAPENDLTLAESPAQLPAVDLATKPTSDAAFEQLLPSVPNGRKRWGRTFTR